ncbi:MAG: methyltransferase [Aggregatilineales bacterium]
MRVKHEGDLSQWRSAWANYHVLLAMTELGMFDLLGDDVPRTAQMIAEQLGADVRALNICAHILVQVGLLSYEDGMFRATETARNLKALLQERKWEWRRRHSFADLLQTVRTGRPTITTSGGILPNDEADTHQFLRMLHRTSEAKVDETVEVLRRIWAEMARPSGYRARILDVGGGHGRYAAAFANSLPDAQVVLFDRELAARIAHELSGTAFETRSGDFLQDDLGGPYDIVFVSYVLSGISIDDGRKLLKRIHNAIVPGGAVVIGDTLIDPNHQNPAFAVDFNLTLLLENEAGEFKTAAELFTLLGEAGFGWHQYTPTPIPEYSLIVGRKG